MVFETGRCGVSTNPNASIDGEVYLELPKDIDNLNKTYPKFVKLKKALYGLRRSPKLWNNELDSTLMEMGFKQGQGDRCLYMKGSGKEYVTFVSVLELS